MAISNKISMFTVMARTVNRLVLISVKLSFIALLFSIGCGPVQKHKLRVATASNVRYAIAEIADTFYHGTGISVEIIKGSSGKMSAQIMQGAPFDIFISADMDYPMGLYHDGYASKEPQLYAYGEIIVWASGKHDPSFESMLHDDVQHIAVPNPKTAPYGVLAIEALKNARILDSIIGKLVYGTNVGQVSQFIVSGAAEIGITSKSMIMSDQLKGKNNWAAIPGNLYSPLGQGIVLINRKEGVSFEAESFYTFMLSDIAREILVNHGYKLPES